MLLGFKIEDFYYPLGESRPKGAGSSMFDGTWTDSVDFKALTISHGLKPGDKVVDDMVISVFETDIPNQHMWNPEGGKFKILWTGSISQEVDHNPSIIRFSDAVPPDAGAVFIKDDAYVVKAGDTLAKISQVTGFPPNAILTANPGVDPTKLRIGQKLKMPGK